MTSARMREHMVDGQIMPGNIMDKRIIAAMQSIPREQFVTERFKGVACVDDDIPVSRNRYLIEPLTLARMIELAEIKATDSVLDLGCATGYSTTIIAKLAQRVVGVEEQRELAEKARQMLEELEIANAEIITGAQISAFGSAGPYDAIIISGGSVRRVPKLILNLLAEGGRLAVVENIRRRPEEPTGLGYGLLMRKIKGAIYTKKVFDASVPLLPGFETISGFSF